MRSNGIKINFRGSVLDISNSFKYCIGVVFICSVVFNIEYCGLVLDLIGFRLEILMFLLCDS